MTTTGPWWHDDASDYRIEQRQFARDRERDRGDQRLIDALAERQAERRGERRKKLRPSDVVVRAATAELLRPFSNSHGGHYLETAQQVVSRIYNDCPATLAFLTKATADPAKTTVVGWAQELVQTSIIDFLTDTSTPSAFAQLAELALQVPERGLVKLPSRTHPVTLVGGWVGETAAKPVYQLSLTSTTLSPYKLAALSVWTAELVDFGVLSIEAIVRDSLGHDLRALLDTTLLDANAATATRPAGLWSGAVVVTPTASGTAAEKLLADLKALTAAVTANAPDAKVVLIANPAQAVSMAGVLEPADFGFTVLMSGYMTAGNVGAVDVNSLAVMVGNLRFQASQDATVVADTSPTAIGTPGSPPVVGAPAFSLFQQDLIGLRSTLTASWAKRRTGCTAIAAGVGW